MWVFRQVRGCIEQVLSIRLLCEKYITNAKDLFWAFMDLIGIQLIGIRYVADAKGAWSGRKIVESHSKSLCR